MQFNIAQIKLNHTGFSQDVYPIQEIARIVQQECESELKWWGDCFVDELTINTEAEEFEQSLMYEKGLTP